MFPTQKENIRYETPPKSGIYDEYIQFLYINFTFLILENSG